MADSAFLEPVAMTISCAAAEVSSEEGESELRGPSWPREARRGRGGAAGNGGGEGEG